SSGSMTVLAQNGTTEAEDAPDASQSELASELPPPDLPTSNLQGFTFELNSTTTVDLAAVPREAVVYELVWREASAARAERIANNLGIAAEVNDRGNGTFDIGDETGEIFVSSDLVQFFTTASPEEGDLPSDEDAITFAREWLRTAGLLPNSADGGRVITRSQETQRVVVQFLPLEPLGLIAAYPSVLVTEGPGGFVVESSIRWPSIERADLYQLRDPVEAWQEIASGQSFLDIQLPEGIADENGVVRGDASYSQVDIGYTTAGLPGGTQYLVPIYIFSGRFTPEDGDGSYRIKAYVSGVANAGAPVG
ncbi:MAG: hypothetical protein AB7G88_14565, partial [Thermomicrobiales bacterium]